MTGAHILIASVIIVFVIAFINTEQLKQIPVIGNASHAFLRCPQLGKSES